MFMPHKILEKKFIRTFKKRNRLKIIYSDSSYQAAEAWIILSQMGCSDLVILETTGSLDDLIKNGTDAEPVMIYNDERKKFQFVPDTTYSDYFPET